MPDLSSHLDALRQDKYSVRGYLSVFTWGEPVAVYEVDSTPTFPAFNLAVSLLDGSSSDVLPGMLYTVETASGYVKGRDRLSYNRNATISDSNLPVRELSRGVINVAAGDVVKVYRYWDLSDKLVTATDDFAPDGEAYSAQNSTVRPRVVDGGVWAGDTSLLPIAYTGSLSEAEDPDSSNAPTHVYSLPDALTLEDGYEATDADVEVTGSTGGTYWVEHEVTDDDNSAVTTRYNPVRLHTDDDPPLTVIMESPPNVSIDGGWTVTLRILDAVTYDSVPEGALAAFWVKEYIGGTVQSFGAQSPGRSHIKLVGYIRRRLLTGNASQHTMTVELVSPLTWWQENPNYSKVMQRNGSPNKWSEVAGLTTRLAKWLLIAHYTNANEIGFDVTFAANVRNKAYPDFFIEKATVPDQLRELANGVGARLTCDRTGAFRFHTILSLLPLASRSAQTTTLQLAESDIIDYEVELPERDTVEKLSFRGFTAGASGNQPVIVSAPGKAPGRGAQAPVLEKMIFDSISDAEEEAGRRWAIIERIFDDANGQRRRSPRVRVTLFGSFDVFDLLGEWVALPDVTRIKQTDIDLSAFRYEVESISVNYVDGTARPQLTLVGETNAPRGQYDPPPAEASTGFDPGDFTTPDLTWPPFVGVIPDVPAFGGLTPGLKRLALIMSDGHIRRTTNFERNSGLGGPSYDDVDLSGTLGDTVLQWCYDARSNISGTHGWVLTSAGIYYVSDIWGTPTATLRKTLSATSVRTIDFDYILSPGLFGIVLSSYSGVGVRATYTSDGGQTWSSEVAVGTGVVGLDTFIPGLAISTVTANKAWTFAREGAEDFERMRVTTTGGASWSALSNVYDDDGYGAGLVIPFADTSDALAYHGYINVGGTSPNPSYANTNNVFRATMDSGMADITPIVSTVRYGPDWQRGRFTLSVSPENKNRLLVCGVDKGRTARGVFLITNASTAADAASTSFVTLVAPSGSVPYTRGALVDNTTAYLFGLNGAIAYSADGATADSRIGNISTSAEVVGVTG